MSDNMFYQRATGSFVAPVVPDTPHCGIDTRECRCAYRIELQFGDDALDGDGFLLDNTSFRDYFRSFCENPVSISCENLCRKIAADLCVMCGNRATRVTVALSPFSGVEVAYHFIPTDERAIAALKPINAHVRLLSEVS